MSESDYIFAFDEQTRLYCETTLNETDESRSSALATLKKWSENNPHLKIDTSNRNLLAFLRACKFNLERTETKLANYAKLRRDAPEWFRNRNPLLLEIAELARLGVFLPLRQLHDNQLVVVIRTAAHNPKQHKQNDVLKTGNMILDVACLEHELVQIFGVIAIFDMEGQSFRHARQLTPDIIKKSVFSWHNYHCRPKKLEFINAPTYINVILSVFKSFMSEKLKSRIRVHYNGNEALESIVDKKILPNEYGGEGGTIEELGKYWYGKLTEYADFFAEDEQYKAEPE